MPLVTNKRVKISVVHCANNQMDRKLFHKNLQKIVELVVLYPFHYHRSLKNTSRDHFTGN